MVHVKLQDYGDFGLANVQEDERGEDAHEDPTNPVYEVEEETSDDGFDIFVIKLMQLWVMVDFLVQLQMYYIDKVMKYREKLLTQLIMLPKNEIRENVYRLMDQ
ncbi:hypothetical protein CK203_031279 [Vitis vinifera]|uniref:Uncharacterized protein n=1 Tax=Vitis vinifera TaxID=29760 RepID=A0A438IX83_VITVI|nr:hypothetical protein CK203_031279 [Vitis vinifera]